MKIEGIICKLERRDFVKSKWKVFVTFVVAVLVMGGCAKKEQVKEENSKIESEDMDSENSTDEAPEEKEDAVEKQVRIYFGNADASDFETENVLVQQISADEIWSQLIEKGVIPMDVTILSCKETEQEGKKALELDVSEKFSTYLNGLGTSGEYITVGSICNTFLDAFDSETIRITVGGKKLETGHAEYPGYMSKYEL